MFSTSEIHFLFFRINFVKVLIQLRWVKFILKIAWASLVRRRLRSVMVILMIAMSLWGLLLMEGIYEGMTMQMIDNAVRSDSGDVSIFASGYREDPDLKKMVGDDRDIRKWLAENRRVRSFTSRILQDGLAATAHYSQNARIIGVDLAEERENGRLDLYVQQGEYSFGVRGRGVILGARLAGKLQASVGSKLIVSAQSSDGEISSLALKITGILQTNNMLLDGQAVLMARDTTRKMLQVAKGVTQIAVILQDREQAEVLQSELQSRFQGLEVMRWDQLYPALMQGKVMMTLFNLITSGIVFGVAGLGIFGVMMVSVLERMREFGIMLAVGTAFSQVRNMVLAESILLGVFGLLGGSGLGFVSLYYFATKGLDLTMFKEGIEAFGMDAVTYAVIHPSYFTTAAVAVVLATFASVILPLRVLKKARPVETINRILM